MHATDQCRHTHQCSATSRKAANYVELTKPNDIIETYDAETEMVCNDSQSHFYLSSVIKAYWADIGVDLTIDVREYAVWKSIQMGNTHPEMIIHHPTLGKPYRHINTEAQSVYNLSRVDYPYINERLSAIWAIENAGNEEERAKLVKELTLQALTQAYVIQLPVPVNYTFWHPWVQNYHGESSIGYQNFYGFVKYIWLDQDLKQKMIGKK